MPLGRKGGLPRAASVPSIEPLPAGLCCCKWVAAGVMHPTPPRPASPRPTPPLCCRGAAPAKERPAASSSHASKPAASAGAAPTEKLGPASGGTAPTERVVAQPPAQPPLEPAAGIQMQELKKDL